MGKESNEDDKKDLTKRRNAKGKSFVSLSITIHILFKFEREYDKATFCINLNIFKYIFLINNLAISICGLQSG